MSNTKQIPLERLKLAPHSIRLSEFNVGQNTPEEELLQALWDQMAVNELMYSIVSNGFWTFEPLIVIEEAPAKEGQPTNFITLEGNRRLAAVKLIHQPQQADIHVPLHILNKINEQLIEQTKELPATIVKNREEAWQYIGFKHVNGPAKWGSYAKAKYIAEIHNQYNVALEVIAYQIGDTNNTVQKLYQALMVLEQANQTGVYKLSEIQAPRIYFSHLYNGLQREGFRQYLGLVEANNTSTTPVPESRLLALSQVLEWLYGSKSNKSQPVIKSQNPDLRMLDAALQSKESVAALNAGEPLSYAYELSRPNDALFEENVLSAKKGLQKARAYLTTGYNGEEDILRTAGTIAQLADDLYEEMARVNKKLNSTNKKHRLTE